MKASEPCANGMTLLEQLNESEFSFTSKLAATIFFFFKDLSRLRTMNAALEIQHALHSG